MTQCRVAYRTFINKEILFCSRTIANFKGIAAKLENGNVVFSNLPTLLAIFIIAIVGHCQYPVESCKFYSIGIFQRRAWFMPDFIYLYYYCYFHFFPRYFNLKSLLFKTKWKRKVKRWTNCGRNSRTKKSRTGSLARKEINWWASVYLFVVLLPSFWLLFHFVLSFFVLFWFLLVMFWAEVGDS